MASTSPFGEHLKREREMRGVSLEEVSSATRISTRFLKAIENGQWDRLPGGAFNRGFIRSASRYLGLDEDGMVAEYALETKSKGPNPALPEVRADLPRDWKRIARALGLIILLIAGGWFAGSRIATRWGWRSSPAPAADATAPKNTVSAPPQPGLASLDLAIRATSPTTLRVVADGKITFDGRIHTKEEKRFRAHDGFEISVRDSAAIRLELNGQPHPMMGSAGQPGRITLTAKDVTSSAGGVD